MRMSDWSSDVCSSDLDGRRQRHAAGPHNAADGGSQIQFPMRAHHDQGKKSQAAYQVDGGQYVLARDDVGQAPKHQSAENGGKTDQTYAEGASHVIKTVVHKHGDAVRAQQIHARSEEHTSELQSLMRISSAVFFLQ